MITKERFEELIKEGATIYDIFRGDIYPVNLLSLIKLGDVGFEYHNEYYHCDICRTLSDFYETKKDAEWEQEFGKIIRTERLELPTWEEFQNKDCVGFITKTGKKVNILNYCFDNEIYISDTWYISETFEYTQDGYTLACRKAKELFLGNE